MQCQVIRSFGGPDGPLAPGTIVDTSGWRPRNRKVLIERRYLQPLPPYGVVNPDVPVVASGVPEADDDAAEPSKRSHKKKEVS